MRMLWLDVNWVGQLLQKRAFMFNADYSRSREQLRFMLAVGLCSSREETLEADEEEEEVWWQWSGNKNEEVKLIVSLSRKWNLKF